MQDFEQAPNCQNWIESYIPDSSIAVFQQAPKRLWLGKMLIQVC
jgi:hypothetical protein